MISPVGRRKELSTQEAAGPGPLCSTCPVTLGEPLTLPQPRGLCPENVDHNWTHTRDEGAVDDGLQQGSAFLPRVETLSFCLL